MNTMTYMSPIMYEGAYGDLLFSKMEQENTLQHMINKTLIMTESTTLKTKTVKLTALYEARLGDSIKSKWNKFIEFIKSLFAKFSESISNILLSYNNYLTKYKDIILNKKFKITLDKSIAGNYSVGTKRCFNVTVPVFTYNEATMKALKEKDSDEAAIKLIIKDIQYDSGRPLTEQLKDYFLGVDEGPIDNIEKLNRADMYNFCLNAKDIETIGKKDISHIEQTTNVLSSAINKELPNNAEVTKEAALLLEKGEYELKKGKYSKSPDEKNTSTTGSDTNNTSTTGSDEKNTSATGSDNTDAAKPGQAKINTNPINSATDPNEKVSGDDQNVKDQAQQAKDAGENKEDFTKAIDKWRSVCNSVITAKMTAQEAIAKDYMQIIHAHVHSYVGKDDDAAQTQKATATNYSKDNDAAKKPAENAEKKDDNAK